MKVKTLIARLKKKNPEAKVVVRCLVEGYSDWQGTSYTCEGEADIVKVGGDGKTVKLDW